MGASTMFSLLCLCAVALAYGEHVHSDSSSVSNFTPVITGLVAPPYTPFTDSFILNLTIVPAMVDELIASGVHNVYVCGTTGESLKLTKEERMLSAEAWMEASKGKDMRVIIHVGAESIIDAEDLAAHAQKIGAYAIGMMPPTFFKPQTIDQLVAWSARVSAAAPKLPFLYYHIPTMTGVNIMVTDFLAAAQGKIPMLAGVKFTDYNLFDFARCVHFGENNTVHGPFTMLYGHDEALLGALTMQADGAVGTTYNFNGATANRLIAAYKAGDMAKAQLEQSRIQAVVALLIKYGAGFGKAVMKMKGFDVGPPRPPTPALTAEQYAQAKQELEDLGFFEWSK